MESRPFSIVPTLESQGPLYPGAAAMALPVRLENPNSIPIFVTSVSVAAAGGPESCPGATNLELIPSSASASRPVQVPAGGSVQLPAQGAEPPAIQLRDLPVNQDACQGVRFDLTYSGSAHG